MLELSKLLLRQGTFELSADLRIEPGSRVSILGPSGGGKSTLLSAIAGFLAPTAGKLIWQNCDITALEPAERPVSILFQDNNLFPHLTVAQNVGLGVRPSLRLSRHEKEHVQDAIARVGLNGLEDRKPSELSGGQIGRAGLARVLLRQRPILLLDEPFAALGPGLRAEMLGLVRQIAEDVATTVLMVTHAPEDAVRLEGQTIFVSDANANPPVDTQALLSNPPPALRAYLE